jgi:aquaporin TIP
VFTVLLTAVDPRGNHNAAPFAIGLAVTSCIFCAAPITGGSMNIARTFGPALISGDFSDFYIYVFGPLIGSLLATIMYQFLFRTPPHILRAEEAAKRSGQAPQ